MLDHQGTLSSVVAAERHIQIGAIVFPQVDQMDLTGPFAVLSRLPNSSFQLFWKNLGTIRDMHGWALTPDATFGEAKGLDMLVIPGGAGQETLMDDEEVLAFLRGQADRAKLVFSICTGALLCGAAGLLIGRKATCYWPALDLLKYFGATSVGDRVVVDGNLITAAGLTSGIDGALRVAAMLRGEHVARQIELAIQYAPEPPFGCGSPTTATGALVAEVKASMEDLISRRLATAKRIGAKLGVIAEPPR